MPFSRRCVALFNPNCCGKRMFQPSVVDAREILPQGRVCGWVSSENGRADLGARLTEEAELSFLVAIPTKPIDSCGNSEYA